MNIKEAFLKPVFSPYLYVVLFGVYGFISTVEYLLFNSTPQYGRLLDFTLMALIGTYWNLRTERKKV